MNKQELIESIAHLPSDCSGPRPMIDKITSLELIKLLDEPQKVTVPQFVADYIKDAKYYEWDLDDVFDHIADEQGESEISVWFYTLGNIDILARAWLDGYRVEKEKRYWVKVKAVDQYLVSVKDEKFLGFLQSKLRSKFTRKELEDIGFGWVFECEGVEVEEVEE